MALVGVRLMAVGDDGAPRAVAEFRLRDGEAILASGGETLAAESLQADGVNLHAGDAGVAAGFGRALGVKMPDGPGRYDTGDGARFLVAVLAQFKHGSRAWAEPVVE